MSGKELKSHVTEEQFEDEKDRKIGNELREEAETETQWLDGTDLPARAGSSGGNHYLIRGSI